MSVPSDFGVWNIEGLRLTLFHPDVEPAAGLWRSLRETEPESIESKPRDQTLVEHGPVGPNRLVLASAAGRLDWYLQSLSSEPQSARGPLMLMGTDPAIPMLAQALRASLGRHRQVLRLAFGATLLRQVESQDEGLAVLSPYLPRLELQAHGDRDFMYRINRRRRSRSASHATINRVAVWSVEEIVSSSIRVTSNQPPRFNATPHLCAKLVLDINTVPEGPAISVGRMPDLFDEFAELAREISTRGDVP